MNLEWIPLDFRADIADTDLILRVYFHKEWGWTWEVREKSYGREMIIDQAKLMRNLMNADAMKQVAYEEMQKAMRIDEQTGRWTWDRERRLGRDKSS